MQTTKGPPPPPLPFALRPMQPDDIPAVMAIERRSFPSPWPEAAYRYELGNGTDSQFYVLYHLLPPSPMHNQLWRIKDQAVILGYMGARFHARSAHVSTIAVHRDWRGQGLGKYLLLTLLEIAAALQAPRATLEVRPSNWIAQRLYAQCGFVHSGTERFYYRDGEDAWLMVLEPLHGSTITHLRMLRQQVRERLVSLSAHCDVRR
ncbi:MAG: GNAT family N-acetyltransferase [Anaerolineae bacterium]|nr:GNAT family N-acetyltransferase [Anaerolineae bacterium]